MDAQTFINQTLTLIGRLGPGRGAGPSESAQALDMWNAMLSSWNTEHLSVYTIYEHEYPLTNDKGDYSFGPGGDFVVTRFVHAGIFVTSNDLGKRSLAWLAGGLVLFAMWIYFALKILLLI